MTVLVFMLGAALAALGTRFSALAFIAAAAVGARDPSVATVATWTAAIAAGWVLLSDVSPRVVAIPALGAAAVLAAAGAPNGAVVLGVWVLGTAAAAASKGEGLPGRRWALGLCASDLLLAAALAGTLSRGFEGWPDTVRVPGVVLLLAAAVVRAPLAAGSDDASAYPALLIVRAQTVLLVTFAVAAADRTSVRAVVVLGAVGFAVAATARRRAVVDVVQELSLVTLTLGATALGWVPSGWTWGALAAGTLMHHLRFTLGRRPAGALADALERSAGIGLPLFPVLLVELEGAFRIRGWLATVVLLGILAGLAGRARMAPIPVRRSAQPVRLERALAVVVLAAAASVAGPLLSLPNPPGGTGGTWPGPIASAAILVVALVGSQAGSVVTRPPRARRSRSRPSPWSAVAERTKPLDRIALERVVWSGVALLALAALALWLVGIGRGFL